MNILTKENFKESLAGKSAVVFFHRSKGCGNCEHMTPIIEEFSKPGTEVFGVDIDEQKGLADPYAPAGTWQLPLTCYFENGKLVNSAPGVIDARKLMALTETFQNMSLERIEQVRLDFMIEKAKAERGLFEIKKVLVAIQSEIETRAAAQYAPKPDAGEAAKVDEVPVPKKALDLSGFPEGQSPEGEGCEG